MSIKQILSITLCVVVACVVLFHFDDSTSTTQQGIGSTFVGTNAQYGTTSYNSPFFDGNEVPTASGNLPNYTYHYSQQNSQPVLQATSGYETWHSGGARGSMSNGGDIASLNYANTSGVANSDMEIQMDYQPLVAANSESTFDGHGAVSGNSGVNATTFNPFSADNDASTMMLAPKIPGIPSGPPIGELTAPVGDAVGFLLLLAAGYGFVRRRKLVGKLSSRQNADL